ARCSPKLPSIPFRSRQPRRELTYQLARVETNTSMLPNRAWRSLPPLRHPQLSALGWIFDARLFCLIDNSRRIESEDANVALVKPMSSVREPASRSSVMHPNGLMGDALRLNSRRVPRGIYDAVRFFIELHGGALSFLKLPTAPG